VGQWVHVLLGVANVPGTLQRKAVRARNSCSVAGTCWVILCRGSWY